MPDERRGVFAHIPHEKVFDMYYANNRNFDWRTKTGEVTGPDDWKYTLRDIKKKLGFHTDSNILDRVKRHGIGPRSQFDTSSRRVKVVDAEPVPAEEAEEETKSYYLAKRAMNGNLLRTTLNSPKGLHALHEVAKDIAKATGVPYPGFPEWVSQIAKLVK